MSDHTQSFNSKSFYGAKCRKRRYEIKTLIEQQVQKQSKYSLPEDFKSRIGGPSSSWKIFYKQNEAFRFAQSTSEDLHVFSYEKEVIGEEKGQRLYLVTSYPVFWHYYRQLCCDKKHHYEIIPEGSVCKIYFDLEYMKEYNPDSAGVEMVQIFIKYVCFWLKKRFSESCDVSDVLNLDASTEHKFSRHLIFQMKKAAFKDNIQLGYFVKEIMEKLEDIITYKDVLSDSGIDVSIDNQIDSKLTTNMEDSHKDAGFNKREATQADSENIQGSNMHRKQQRNNKEGSLREAEFDRREATLADSEINKDDRPLLGNVKKSPQKTGVENEQNSNLVCSLNSGKFDYGEPTLAGSENFKDMKQETNNTEDNLDNDEVHHGYSHQLKSESRFEELNELLEIFNMEDLQSLFIYNKNGDKITFVDTGVYTKNRNFRLYLSSKLGKNNPLVLSDDNQFLSNTQEDVFLASLISNVSYTDELRILKFCDDVKYNEKGVCFPGRNKNTEATLEGERSSPYPEIDRYIKTLINGGDHHGYVRHWTYFTNGELLIYDIAKYRYCENINRQHRSNNIMYVVDIRRGVYYQKCHDPDCKKQDFKSQEHEIPKEYLPTYLLEQDDFMSNSDDDDLLIQAMENVEKMNAENSDSKNFSDCDLSDNELLSITNEIEKSSDEVHKQ
ncbi:hypothetical protein LOTGIDRAFT_230191 [Lottia gigantea]|uniref:DNA-directed primase/polymerase protein n=1 Tax=Lottia gigantea TaxID=225164 RepID=V4BDR6_LOTGI|nr:hypothetical protein LOTGIDRAFT_230191 [Lottia gigantea]ESP03872.1 hypothetical protein LOTGIDRAFT_230191 [Lottia gigantea]